MAVFARHGFQNLAERAKLGRFLLEKFSYEDIQKYSTQERLRMCFEQLGPTYVKFGQVLATRPDLIPKSFAEEFKKLHDQVATVPFEQIKLSFPTILVNLWMIFLQSLVNSHWRPQVSLKFMRLA